MYIWILLATIMIALSFFNLSPRADKEGAFTETKASSLVNRFRIEHSAFSRVAECKMVNRAFTNTDPVVFSFPENTQDETIWAEKALPIGYSSGNDLAFNYHYIYCLTGDLTNGGSPSLSATCTHTVNNPVYRYSVSFAPLPNRWRSKDKTADDNPIKAILPVLGNAIAKQYVKGTVFGVLNCDEAGNCDFQGSNAYEKQKKTGLTRLSFQKGAGNDFYTQLFANTDFANKCAGNICFFAVHKLSVHDVDSHCATLYGS